MLAIALQQGLRMNAVIAGLAMAPFALAVFLASLAGPRMAARYGAGRVVTLGCLPQFVGGALLVLVI